MSPIAVVNRTVSITVHGAGPVLLTSYITPVTSVHVKPMPAPVAGLKPTSPVTAEVGTLVIADFARITKLTAVPTVTGAGPWPAPATPVPVPEAVGEPELPP